MTWRRSSLLALIALAALSHGLSSARAQQPEEPDDVEIAEPEAADPAEPAAEEEAAAGPTADPALNPLALLDKRSLDAFRNLPLFTPSRRRPAPPPKIAARAVSTAAPPPPAAPPEPPELSLAGVAIGPEGSIAVVQELGESRVQRLRLGDQVGGWLVTAIEPEGMKITLDDREHQYRLFQKKEASAASGADPDEEVAPRKTPRRPPPAGRNSFGHNGNDGGNATPGPRRNSGGDGPEGQE